MAQFSVKVEMRDRLHLTSPGRKVQKYVPFASAIWQACNIVEDDRRFSETAVLHPKPSVFHISGILHKLQPMYSYLPCTRSLATKLQYRVRVKYIDSVIQILFLLLLLYNVLPVNGQAVRLRITGSMYHLDIHPGHSGTQPGHPSMWA